MHSSFFITGIGTGVGKTIVSAIVCKALNASYWKPVQCGSLNRTDSDLVRELTNNSSVIHPEKYRLGAAMSPHAAARLEGVELAIKDFELPSTKPIVVEGAGGILVPINNSGETMLDLMKKLELPVMLVSRNYLGSINHTLMSINILKNNGLTPLMVLVTGPENLETIEIIQKLEPMLSIAYIGDLDVINQKAVEAKAEILVDFLQSDRNLVN